MQLLMNRRLLAMLLLTMFWSPMTSQTLAQDNTEESPPNVLLWHVDFAELQKSPSGKIILESIRKIPFVKTSLASMPASLEFLLEANFKSLTLSVSNDDEQRQEAGLLEINCEFNSASLIELLTHANGYARVQFNGTDIHHWVTDFDTLGNQFMGAANEDQPPEESENSDPVYLAIPETGRVLISNSLASLTELLSHDDATLMTKVRQLQGRQQGDLISLYINTPEQIDEVPGIFNAFVRENEQGQMSIQATLQPRTDSERQTAVMLDSIMKNSDAVVALEQSFTQAANASDNPATEQAGPDTLPDDHQNRLSIGFRVNSASIEAGDWRQMIKTFVNDVVSSDYTDDLLTLQARFYLGKCEVHNTVKGSVKSQDYNFMFFQFFVYTTQEERDSAVRIAQEPTETGKKIR